MIKKIKIESEFIKMDSLLKYADMVSSGGEAKSVILDGKVKFNGQVCTMRGKKVRSGDCLEFEGSVIEIE